MAVDVANFITRNFQAPDRAELDRAKYGNALMRNQVARIPQTNRAQDLGLQAAEQEIGQRGTEFSDQQKANARGVLARSLAAISQSPQPKIAAQQFIASPDFQAAGKLLGLPIEQFTVTAQDTDDVIRSGAMDWARALGSDLGKKDQDVPSNIREYEYYSRLSPAEKQQFLEMKRSMNPYAITDLGGGRIKLDRRTGDVTQLTSAADEATGAAAITGAQTTAKTQAERQQTAIFDLPRIKQNSAQALKAITDLRKHPGLSKITGAYSLAPIVPGTEQAAANALAEQIQGRTFLEAFNSLRGGGAITEVEGSKAESAIGRLNRRQSTKDYQAALDDLASVIQIGLQRAEQQAGAAPSGQAPILRYDPSTGTFR